MGRKKLDKPPKKLEIGLPVEVHESLLRLSKIGGYGTTPTDVARYLLQRGIDDLRRADVLKTR
jgi:hypothetical protein